MVIDYTNDRFRQVDDSQPHRQPEIMEDRVPRLQPWSSELPTAEVDQRFGPYARQIEADVLRHIHHIGG